MSDGAFAATTFVVIDFEGTTPPGRRPEPIEVAALALRARDGKLTEIWRYKALIRPPAHAPITPFDARQTGITPQMVSDQPAAATILTELDRFLTAPPYRLVAHHAPTEAGIICDYHAICPCLAATPLLDTVRLGRVAYPQLPSHRLDVLLDHLTITRPADRHRAMPDVVATAQVFTHLTGTGRWRTLTDLTAAGGLEPKRTRPHQDALF